MFVDRTPKTRLEATENGQQSHLPQKYTRALATTNKGQAIRNKEAIVMCNMTAVAAIIL